MENYLEYFLFIIDKAILGLNKWVVLAYFITVGTCVGSFINVIIVRIPNKIKLEWQKECENFTGTEVKESWCEGPKNIFSRSTCMSCGKNIKWRHNIPVVGWIFIRGKCYFCKSKVSVQYPIIEAVTGAIFGLGVLIAWPSITLGLAISLAATIAIALLAIDMKHMLLPDALIFTLMWLGLASSATESTNISSPEAITNVVVVYLALILFCSAFKAIRGVDGMGMGDVKYLAAISAWLPMVGVYYVILGTSIISLLLFAIDHVKSSFSRRREEKLRGVMVGEYGREGALPMGPSISLSFIVAIFMEYAL